MAADLITTVPSQTQLTINNQTQGSLARTEDLRSIYRASPNVPLSQSSPHHASCHLICGTRDVVSLYLCIILYLYLYFCICIGMTIYCSVS